MCGAGSKGCLIGGIGINPLAINALYTTPVIRLPM